MQRWRDSTPLCPTGHLPSRGGDWQLRRPARPASLETGESWRVDNLPLKGEMAGRPEGGERRP
ncbi:hypothetical protein EOD23_09150 [Mesorhizobium sp. USDA-HM6]|nr:hypothetical protein EOD23_09150 [Mesorhizobium sp. USDA-HM6]